MRNTLLAVSLLAFRGSAEAAEPGGKPVLIELPTVLPTGLGANGFVVIGNFYSGA